MLQKHSILIGLILFGLAEPVAAQTTRNLSPEQEWEQLIQQSEAEAARLQVVKADSARQVIEFRIEAGMLTARPLLPANSFREIRVQAPDLKGIVRLKQFAPSAANVPSPGFQFIQTDLTSFAAGHISTMLSVVAGRLILSRDVENGQTLRSVQLLIDPPPMPGDDVEENPVRLLVNQTSLNAATNELRIQCHAKSFTELRFGYRDEVNTYLRPIIRGLAQEQIVFAVPKEVAWRVLGRDDPLDPPVAQRVQSLVVGLGADDFRARQTAVDELKKMGQDAIWILASIDRNKLSLQQNAEVDSIIASSAPLPSVSFRGLEKDIHFLMDVLYSDDVALRSSALKRLREMTEKPVEFDMALGLEARIGAIAALRDQLIPVVQPVSK